MSHLVRLALTLLIDIPFGSIQSLVLDDQRVSLQLILEFEAHTHSWFHKIPVIPKTSLAIA